MYNYDLVEAACCLWEHVINREVQGDASHMDWVRAGEGAAVARQHCINLAVFCEAGYQMAKAEGYDDCFDWDFVPAWFEGIYLLYEKQSPELVTLETAKEIGRQVGVNWRQARDPRPPGST